MAASGDRVVIEAALNGNQSRSDHPAVPVTPDEVAAEARRQRHHHGLGHDQAPRGVEVRAHPYGVDLEPLYGLQRLAQGPGRQEAELGKSLPLGVPATQPPLMLLRHGSEQRGRQGRDASGGRQDGGTGNRVALVWHG